MIYYAYNLLAHLRCLQLVGQDEDGNLEWLGSTEQWEKVDKEAELILQRKY